MSLDSLLSPPQLEWRDEVREVLRSDVDEALREEIRATRGRFIGPLEQAFRLRCADRGWYALTWPKEYGGLEKDAVEFLVLIRELELAGVPGLPIDVTSIAPTIIRYGTEQNKRDWLPGVAGGRIRFALGYSEPNAGTDLANLATRAELDGDEWVISGQKLWNSGAHYCTHEWLAVRTDPRAPKHSGISLIIVPIDAPGIEVRELKTWGQHRTNEVFFDEVRVPASNLIGELNGGWRYIVNALDLERVAMGNAAGLERMVDELLVQALDRSDEALAAPRSVTDLRLAELVMDVEIANLLNFMTASLLSKGQVSSVHASMQKVFATELRAKVTGRGMALLGPEGYLTMSDRGPLLHGELEFEYRRTPFLRFGGGANEIQRDIIATRGLGLPRSKEGR